MISDDGTDGVIKIRFQLLKAYRFIFQNRTVTGGTGQFHNQEKHGFRRTKPKRSIFLNQFLEIVQTIKIRISLVPGDSLAKDAPA